MLLRNKAKCRWRNLLKTPNFSSCLVSGGWSGAGVKGWCQV
ncbi:hypothetical protein FHS21_001382 [Phyllobacterium trifolii]|uniref:Uncharacterized protein n=1 Tax=Phyllobacterium trifolii TaxID=300193 RepID=A0A839U8D5_9HYPH|nr:hypothetical protein [Phyllobacterium trifolii]